MSSVADNSSDISPDLVFEILSNTRRRMVLYYLRQNGGSATVQVLAEQVAALENDTTVDNLVRQQRKRVYVSLYQTHLPKLEETGIIRYDEDRSEVFLTDRAGEIDSYLTPTSEFDYPWQTHYLVLSIAGGLLFLLSFVGFPGIAAIPTLILGLVVMLSFILSAGVQFWQHRRQQKEIPVELLEHSL